METHNALVRVPQVNGDIPPRLKKSAHEVILEFIRSRPPLNPVSVITRSSKYAKALLRAPNDRVKQAGDLGYIHLS